MQRISSCCLSTWSSCSPSPRSRPRSRTTSRGRDSAAGSRRAELARNLFTFGHFPLISGIVFFAIAAKHMVPHPGDTLPTADRWLLAGSVVTLIGGYLSMQIASYLARTVERLLRLPDLDKSLLCSSDARVIERAPGPI